MMDASCCHGVQTSVGQRNAEFRIIYDHTMRRLLTRFARRYFVAIKHVRTAAVKISSFFDKDEHHPVALSVTEFFLCQA